MGGASPRRLQFRSFQSDNPVVRGRPRVPGRVLVAGSAVALTVALAEQPVQGTFTAVAGSAGNTVGAAAQFCASPGSVSLISVEDSWANESTPAWTGGGDDYYNQVGSQSGVDYRAFFRFSLPSIPSRCVLSSATLRLYTDGPDANRTLGVYRGDPTDPLWTETSLSWSSQPDHVGTPALALTVASNGYLSWNVTTLTRELYAGINNGFVVRDQAEDDPTGFQQQYIARQGGNPPRLDLVWD